MAQNYGQNITVRLLRSRPTFGTTRARSHRDITDCSRVYFKSIHHRIKSKIKKKKRQTQNRFPQCYEMCEVRYLFTSTTKHSFRA